MISLGYCIVGSGVCANKIIYNVTLSLTLFFFHLSPPIYADITVL
jgi:hypothetical protein